MSEFTSKVSLAELVSPLRASEHDPLGATIEIADRCNEVCVHCYQIQGQKGEMTTEEVYGILDGLADMGVLFLTISGGECTLRSDFLDIVAHARARRFVVKIFTNGLRVDEAMASALAELAVQEVQISLYSADPGVHDGVTGVPGSFHKTVAAARRLVAVGVRVVLKSPVMTINPEYQTFIALVDDIGADYMLSLHIDPRENDDRSTEGLRLDRERQLEVQRDPAVGRRRTVETALRPKTPVRSLCAASSGQVHVEANGALHPCSSLTVSSGDGLAEGGPARAFAEDPVALALRYTTWQDVHGCRECSLQPYCGRCFANAYAEVGDMMAPYRTACRRAAIEYELTHEQRPHFLTVAGRDEELGPFEVVGPHTFAPIEDQLCASDHERRESTPWITRAGGPAPSGDPKLVQLGRGRKRRQEPAVDDASPHG